MSDLPRANLPFEETAIEWQGRPVTASVPLLAGLAVELPEPVVRLTEKAIAAAEIATMTGPSA